MKKNFLSKSIIDLFNIFIILGFVPIYYKTKWLSLDKIPQINFYLILIFTYIVFIKRICSKKLLCKRGFLINRNIYIFLFSVFVISLISTNSHKEFLLNYLKLVCTVIYANYLVEYYSIKDLVCILVKVHSIILILNIIYFNLFPNNSYDILDNTSAVSALFTQKNQFGTELAFGVLMSYINLIYGNNRMKILSIFNIIASIYILTLVQSVTSIITIIIPIILLQVYRLKKGKINIVNILIILNFLVVIIVFYGDYFNEFFVKILNRDITLTGRVDIWKAILATINMRIFLGFGYFTFWGYNPYYESRIRSMTFSALSSGHNAFFELLLNVGIIGVIIFILFLLNIGKKIVKIKEFETIDISLVIVYLSYIILFFISERTLWPLHYQTLLIFVCTIIVNNKLNNFRNKKE